MKLPIERIMVARLLHDVVNKQIELYITKNERHGEMRGNQLSCQKLSLQKKKKVILTVFKRPVGKRF